MGCLEPWQVQAMSVHGTGTPLGDPIEVGALGQSFVMKGKSDVGERKRLILQSNKACFGHTEGAAGEYQDALCCCHLTPLHTLLDQCYPKVM